MWGNEMMPYNNVLRHTKVAIIIISSKKTQKNLAVRTEWAIFALSKQRRESLMTKIDIDKKLKIQPHQSGLGNSSNHIEIPRQAWPSDGGPHSPSGEVFVKTGWITKDGGRSNPVYSEFHRILWCGFLQHDPRDAVYRSSEGRVFLSGGKAVKGFRGGCRRCRRVKADGSLRGG